MAGVWPRPPGTPKVADAGLEHLKVLTALEVLRLQETQATAEGVEKLQ